MHTSTLAASCLLPVCLVLSVGAQEGRGRGGTSEHPAAAEKSMHPGPAARKGDALRMTRGVVCREIRGFEDYEVLPDAALTSEEKLQIYYRPLNYTVVGRGGESSVHLMQDGQIRREGEKRVLRAKKNILDFEPRRRGPMEWIFLRNSVPLKGLAPGEYEYDIILRDANGEGPPARQAVRFRIIPRGTAKAPAAEPSRRPAASPAPPGTGRATETETPSPS